MCHMIITTHDHCSTIQESPLLHLGATSCFPNFDNNFANIQQYESANSFFSVKIIQSIIMDDTKQPLTVEIVDEVIMDESAQLTE